MNPTYIELNSHIDMDDTPFQGRRAGRFPPGPALRPRPALGS